jgi:uncharacterized membrane protein YcaP (DUF421 family)
LLARGPARFDAETGTRLAVPPTMAISLLSIAGRVLAIYLFLLLVLRLMGRGVMSQLRPIDLLTMLLMSETVSPALTAGDHSLPGGLVAVSTLGIAAWFTSWLSFRYRLVDRALDGSPLLLINRGRVDAQVLRSQRITDEELRTALHEHGVLSVAEVRKAFVEPDGSITIVKTAERATKAPQNAKRDAEFKP